MSEHLPLIAGMLQDPIHAVIERGYLRTVVNLIHEENNRYFVCGNLSNQAAMRLPVIGIDDYV